MCGYVWLNIIIKKLREIYKTPLYITIDVTIKPNWQKLIELANTSGNNEFENDNFEQTFDFHDSNKFEKIIEVNFGKTLVQTILNPKQIIDDHSKKLTIVLIEGFWPLGLFCDPYSKEYNFPTLFYDNAIPNLLYVHIKR